MDAEMHNARVASLYKKGDPNNLENYRPISLLNTLFKIIASVIKMRIEEAVEQKIMQSQFGFRVGKDTTQAIHIARRIQEYAERAGIRGTMIFLDWEKTFDKISHEMLTHVLISYNVPQHILSLIQDMYKSPKFHVVIDGTSSEQHVQKAGIRQGCPLSPYLFLLVMHRIFEQVGELKYNMALCAKRKTFETVDISNIDFSEILFADDTLIFAAEPKSLEALLWSIEIISDAYGLRLNRTKCISLNMNDSATYHFFNGDEVPINEQAEYLGVIMHAKADPNIEANRRIASARYTWKRLKDFWRDGHLSLRERVLIYDSVVSSKLMYGMHVLPLRDDILHKLDTFFYRGLRQLLKVPSTYIDREYTNTYLLEKTEELCNSGKSKNKKQIIPISQRLIQRSIKELGEIYRLPLDDARRQATLTETNDANVPQKYRVGKPRIHWTLITMQRAWNRHNMQTRLQQHDVAANIEFDRNNEEHKTILEAAALQHDF